MEIEDFGLPKSTLLKRMAVFKPCESMAELAQWIRVFFGIRFPEKIVSDESNSAPMPLLWELYDRMRRNDLEGFEQAMVYASRFSGKTLMAAVLEVLTILHMPRNVAHMAAIENQAKKAQAYVKDFTGRPIIRDFIFGDNAREVKIASYIHKKTKVPLTEKEFNKLTPPQKEEFEPRREQYIKIVICNMAGANGDHVEFMCVDGSTEILIKNTSSTNRERVRRTAKGIFQRIAGESVGGHPGGETPKEVTEPKVKIEVLTLNVDTGELEFKPITRAHRNKKSVIHVETESRKITVTPDHPLFVYGKGFVEASDINIGDSLLELVKGKTTSIAKTVKISTHETKTIKDGDSWEQVVIGSLLGDCGIYKKPENNPYLSEQHCLEQKEYMDWKRSIISNRLRTRDKKCTSGYTGLPLVGFCTGNSPLLLPYIEVRNNPALFVDKLTALGLAVWYMDDGCAGNGFKLSTECWSEQQNIEIALKLKERFGLEVEPFSYSKEDKVYWALKGGVDAKRLLVDIVKKYIHPIMAYKFDLEANKSNCKFCGIKYWFYEQGSGSLNCGSAICQKIQKKALKLTKVTKLTPDEPRWVYDFTVEGNNNFWTNGLCSKNCVDECDVIPRQNIPAYYQAKGGIPVGARGQTAFTLLTSTRKSRVGLVQKEIDKADKSGLQLRHWNIIDVTAPCPTTRHKPELPKQVFYINDENVAHLDEKAFEEIPATERNKWYPVEGYNGCAKCKLFPGCKGALATRQEGKVSDFKSGGTALLVDVSEVASKFKSNTPEFITTEFMVRKPDASGLVYPRLKKEIHFKTSQQLAELVLGPDNAAHASTITSKHALWNLLKSRGARFYSGMDFGFGHLFAVATIAVWGQYALVIDAFGQSRLELDDKIEAVQYLKDLNPTIFGDPEDPATVTTFKRRGFKMVDWSKSQGSVKAGIEIVRKKIFSAGAGATLFFLSEDAGIGELFREMEEYAFSTDAAGEFTEIPEKEDDDFPDALRYCIMNSFGKNGVLNSDKTSLDNNIKPPDPFAVLKESQSKWMSRKINELTGQSSDEAPADTSKIVRKGGFVWSGD
jgi:hypothetical protein